MGTPLSRSAYSFHPNLYISGLFIFFPPPMPPTHRRPPLPLSLAAAAAALPRARAVMTTTGENRGKRRRKTHKGYDDDNDDVNDQEQSTGIMPSDIPLDLVSLILERLDVKEAVRLSCTCKSWRATAPLYDPTLRKSPWMLSTMSDDTYRLWSADKRFSLPLAPSGFSLLTTFLRGSCHGWLLHQQRGSSRDISDRCARFFFFNPFSRARFDLPAFSVRCPIQRFLLFGWLLSVPPTDPDCVLFLVSPPPGLRGRWLYHAWRVGDSGWTTLPKNLPLDNGAYVWIKGRGFITFEITRRSLVSLQLFPLRITTLGVASPPIDLLMLTI